jgi:hypothetical protein
MLIALSWTRRTSHAPHPSHCQLPRGVGSSPSKPKPWPPACAPHQPLHELATHRGRAVLLVLAAAVVAAGEEQLLLQLRHLVAHLLQLLVPLAPAKNVQGVRRGILLLVQTMRLQFLFISSGSGSSIIG